MASVPARGMRAIVTALARHRAVGTDLAQRVVRVIAELEPVSAIRPRPWGNRATCRDSSAAWWRTSRAATLIGRDALSLGGDAADAAVAMGLTLAVTLPSRAGLGAGGACLAYSPPTKSVNSGVPEAIMFVPRPPVRGGANADRPAAVPMLARGLFLLHARYGRRPFESLIVPAERYGALRRRRCRARCQTTCRWWRAR